mmetsp:Transcript_24904/g.64866  ORF Transcript_24904/g.64866 Transcript_24904/m.64866 type:complete len:260 (+) Transcript_24904:2229-3008(+)
MAEQMASIAPSRISVSGERAASKQTGRRGECRKGTVTFPPNLSHEARHANMRSTMTLSPLYSSRQCSKKGKTDTEFWPYWSATRLRSSCVSTRRGLPISSGRTVRNSSNPTITVRSFSLPKFSIMSSAGDVHTSHIWMARSAMARASCTAMLRLRPPRVEIEAQSASRSESRESSGTSVNAACTFMRIVCAAKKCTSGSTSVLCNSVSAISQAWTECHSERSHSSAALRWSLSLASAFRACTAATNSSAVGSADIVTIC